MFQTDPILWLQSLESRWLTPFLVFVSHTGAWSGYVVLALIVTFAINFRLGFALFQMILWNGLLTDFLKELFALPRPAEVDSTVQLLGEDSINPAPFEEMDGSHFLDLPEEEAIEFYRAQEDVRFGLPSGHVSMATTFWLGSAVLLRKRWLTFIAVGIIVVMAISRMYLGRHFLGDVLAGFVLGVAVILVVRHLVLRSRAASIFSGAFTPASTRSRYLGVALVLSALLIALLLVFQTLLSVDSVSRILAANLAFAIITLRGTPTLAIERRGRVMVAAIAITLYVASTFAVELLLATLGWRETVGGVVIDGSVPLLVGLLGTVALCSRLRLLRRRTRRSPPVPMLLRRS
jgi:membrane-associated phospholipid phosphatase